MAVDQRNSMASTAEQHGGQRSAQSSADNDDIQRAHEWPSSPRMRGCVSRSGKTGSKEKKG
jgi:hypothetical protein